MMDQLKKMYREEWDYFKAQIMRPAIVCALGFFAVAVFYYAASMQDMAAAQTLFSQIGEAFAEKGLLAEMSSLQLFWMIFSNNIVAGFFVFAAGIIPFISLPFWLVLFNAALAGVVVAVSQDSGASALGMVASLLPHGIVELPALFFTAGLGIRIGLTGTKKLIGRGKDLSYAATVRQTTQSFLLVALPLFLLAAFIEAFITVAIVK